MPEVVGICHVSSSHDLYKEQWPVTVHRLCETQKAGLPSVPSDVATAANQRVDKELTE